MGSFKIILAQDSLHIKDLNDLYEIGKKTDYWIDSSGLMTFEEVYAQKLKAFKPSSQTNYDIGFDNHIAVWVKFKVYNRVKTQLLFELSNSNLDSIGVFVRNSSKQVMSYLTGDDYAFPNRFAHINRFIFPLPASDCEVFVRVKSHTSLFFTPRLGTTKSITERLHRLYLWHGFYFGVIILIIIYNLILFFRLREWLYLLYVGNISSLGLIVAFENGYALEFLWYNLPQVNDYPMLVYTTSIATVFFIESFLDARKQWPKIYWVFPIIYLSYLLLLGLDLAGFRAIVGQFFRILSLFNALFFWFLALNALRKQSKNLFIILFFVGWSGNLLGIIIYILGVMSVVSFEGWGRESIQIGTIWEIVILAWAIAEKMRAITINQAKTQLALVQSLQTNEKLLKEQNQLLEEKVIERTREIAEQNSQLIAQEEELKQQHEALESQANMLLKQNQLIEAQNQALQSHQIHLEQLVQERTQELIKNNQLLVWQNDKLEKFSFITAHNFRAPVARILGLVNLLEMENKQLATNPILSKILTTANDLDEVIKDMNLILEMQRQLEANYEVVDLADIYEKTTQKLAKEITKHKIKIEADFTKGKRVFGIAYYLENIFYELMSNAIKFRYPKKPCVISIKSFKQEKQVGVIFQDNGLGMDLKIYGDKIFNLYQKYHLHRKGKGIGLYLVRTQVEAMQGQIKIESQSEKGTKITILLPN